MEAFIGLLLVIGILGGGFLLLCAICFGIVFLLSFIKDDREDKWNEHYEKISLESEPWRKPGYRSKGRWKDYNDNDKK